MPDIEIINTEDEPSAAEWKAMYLHMSVALEDAIRLLIKAQQECEDMYIER